MAPKVMTCLMLFWFILTAAAPQVITFEKLSKNQIQFQPLSDQLKKGEACSDVTEIEHGRKMRSFLAVSQHYSNVTMQILKSLPVCKTHENRVTSRCL